MAMQIKKWVWTMGIGALSVAFLSGCGSTPSASQTTTSTPAVKKNQTYVIGGASYQGQKNLQKWEQKAKSDPTNVQYLYSSGVSAYLNNQPQLAISYYTKAAKIQPKNGELWNNIGNVYRNSYHNNQQAISYYQKATVVDPKYDYGWYNWAYTLVKMNNIPAAKIVVNKALTTLPKSDPLYKAFNGLVTPTKATTPPKAKS